VGAEVGEEDEGHGLGGLEGRGWGVCWMEGGWFRVEEGGWSLVWRWGFWGWDAEASRAYYLEGAMGR